MVTEITSEQLQVEKFWKDRIGSFTLEQEEKICDAYKKYIIGTTDFHQMGLVHAGVNDARDDYAGFYGELVNLLNLSGDKTQTLVREGFDYAGLMCRLARANDCSGKRTPSQQIVDNMRLYK